MALLASVEHRGIGCLSRIMNKKQKVFGWVALFLFGCFCFEALTSTYKVKENFGFAVLIAVLYAALFFLLKDYSAKSTNPKE